jgi:hypothetical protein
MKSLLILCFSLLQGMNIMAQSNIRYQEYTTKVKQFSKPVKVLSDHIDAQGNGYIEYTNAKKQVLRFRVNNKKIQILHGGISFQLFSYENSYLKKIETFDLNGNLHGEGESHNEAVVVFIIEKPELYLKKKKLIDDAEGNIDMKDDSKEKIIKVKLYNANNLQVLNAPSSYITSYITSKMYWDYNVRMYWP